MAGALGLVLTTDVAVQGSRAIPVYVDDSLPIVGPSRACVVTTGEIPQMGGPPLAVRLAPFGTPAIGPALPVYVVPGGGSLAGGNPLAYTNKVLALSPLAYWPMAETSGLVAIDATGNARDGAYKGAGEPLLGQTGIGDGRSAPLFDGTNDYNNVFTASLQAAFNSAEGTLAAWAQISNATFWTDGIIHRVAQFQADANNVVRIGKTTVNNQVNVTYLAGSVSKSVNFTTAGPLTWIHLAITWSKSADQVIFYVNGVQQGATLTGLGVWAGSLVSNSVVVGAGSTAGGSPWGGSVAHAAVWASALSAAQILSIATVP